jgi:hypothetical protein
MQSPLHNGSAKKQIHEFCVHIIVEDIQIIYSKLSFHTFCVFLGSTHFDCFGVFFSFYTFLWNPNLFILPIYIIKTIGFGQHATPVAIKNTQIPWLPQGVEQNTQYVWGPPLFPPCMYAMLKSKARHRVYFSPVSSFKNVTPSQ